MPPLRGIYPVFTGDGDLTIDGFPLREEKWIYADDIWRLWRGGNRRGGNVIIPGAPGTRPYRRRRTTTPVSLSVLISGDWHYDGYATPSGATVWEQIEINHEHVIDSIVEDPGTTDGTRTALLTRPNGLTRTGPVHVLDFVLGGNVLKLTRGHYGLATLELELPDGRLV